MCKSPKKKVPQLVLDLYIRPIISDRIFLYVLSDKICLYFNFTTSIIYLESGAMPHITHPTPTAIHPQHTPPSKILNHPSTRADLMSNALIPAVLANDTPA
jgi:hypothetical protein